MKQEEYIQGKWYYGEVFQEVYGIFRHSHNSKYSPHYNESYLENGNTLGAHFMASYDSIATPSQIEQCLKAYAEKNGYVNGAQIFIVGSPITTKLQGSDYRYDIDGDYLEVGAICYHKGKWAEIVAHAPSVQDKQDKELTNSIHEFVKNKDVIVSCPTDESGNYDLSGLYVCLDDKEVTLKELCETYYKMLDIKTIIG